MLIYQKSFHPNQLLFSIANEETNPLHRLARFTDKSLADDNPPGTGDASSTQIPPKSSTKKALMRLRKGESPVHMKLEVVAFWIFNLKMPLGVIWM